jgi:hypothetical protein
MHSSDKQLDEVAELLAKRAAVVRLIPPTRQKLASMKQANILESMGKVWDATPMTARGALIGGGIGGLGGYLSQSMSDKDDDEKRPWRAALTGAMAGGALGGGIGMAIPNIKAYQASQKDSSRLAELNSELDPSMGKQVVNTAGDAALAAAYPLAAAGLYHGQRNLSPDIAGKWGRMASPEQVLRAAQGNPGGSEAKWVNNLVGSKRTGPTALPSVSELEEALLKGNKAGNPKPTGWGMPAKVTASGAPHLRREWSLLRAMGKDPYYVTGRGGSKWRALGGTTAAILAGLMAQKGVNKLSPDARYAERDVLRTKIKNKPRGWQF